ncbi:hypothetical protein [Aneurinibacillus tyrosinisolvens]|uniref:hypothetical protein n=1 Tax=Aneurinibacillus tyrosinisolvens TaxID=1443435 RepID=UPI00069BC78A|nr:hypothetical protein [Aneurinibacillus tyrosinisolvens]
MVVSFCEFVEELKRAIEYQRDGGTDYRLKTAELSLYVANQDGTMEPFYESRESSREVVARFIKDNHDEDRIDDVAKALYTISRRLVFKATMPIELKEHIAIRREERRKKGLSLIKITEDEFREDLKTFDDAFENGVFCTPNTNKYRVKVRKLFDFCNETGRKPEELTEEEWKEFLEEGK